MKITLKDGSCKEYAEAKSVYEIACDISEGLARVACAGEIDGKTVPCLYVTLRYEEQGIDIYEALAAQKRGSFFGVVTVSTLSENSLAETAKKITLE